MDYNLDGRNMYGDNESHANIANEIQNNCVSFYKKLILIFIANLVKNVLHFFGI